MRIGVVDVGSNSTRLLVADVGADGVVDELEHRSRVTRLADGLEHSGALSKAATDRVMAALREYRATIDELGAEKAVGVLTSAARDASDGERFAATIREELAIDARVLDGSEEARLTYRGALSGRRTATGGTILVIDIGGGSTELVVGRGGSVSAHASTQVGVVRHSERHLLDDPPQPEQLEALRSDVAAIFRALRERFMTAASRAAVDVSAASANPATTIDGAVAVAGTATSCAAILLELEPYDSARVEGFELTRHDVASLLARTSALSLAERRALPGLHPDRALTVVAGIAILLEAMATFGLGAVTVSEHDILRGAALFAAGLG